jgi:hypothetical protein
MQYLFLAFTGACIAKKEVKVALGSLTAARLVPCRVRFASKSCRDNRRPGRAKSTDPAASGVLI